MRKLWIAGDWHGNGRWALGQLEAAYAAGCDAIVQLGDFGIWHGTKGQNYLDHLNATAAGLAVPIYFVDGNHECFPELYEYPVDDDGFRYVRDYVVHAPRGHQWEWSGVACMSIGGAVSIDRHYRTLGLSYWTEETLSTNDALRVEEAGGADVLFTHDSPANVPMRLLPDAASLDHRLLMSRLAKSVRPKLWMHGHMHHPMQYDFWHDGGPANVVALAADGQRHSYCILDLRERELKMVTDTNGDVFKGPRTF